MDGSVKKQRRARWLHRDDRGAVIVIAALAMVVLFGFVGFAVDLGMVFNERRQEQAAVDAATLSVARMAFEDIVGLTAEEYFDEVVRLSLENMDGSVTEAEWRQRFLDCTDPGRAAAGYPIPLGTSSGTVDCISLDGFPATRIRVRLPTTQVDTAFASVLGFDQWEVSAFAEAGLSTQPGAPNVIPFAMSEAGDAGGRYCLRRPPAGLADPAFQECDAGMFQGNTGVIQIVRPSFPNNQACNGGFSTVIQYNVAMGIDHLLSVYNGATIMENCASVTAGLQPNTIDTGTGQGSTNTDMAAGLIGTSIYPDGGPARLKRGPFPKTLNVRGQMVDDKPLWEFIDEDLNFGVTVPFTCNPTVIANHGVDPRVGLDECFASWAIWGSTEALFTMDILDSPRFTWVPEATVNLAVVINGQSQPFRIKQFRPLFLQTLYYTQNANRGCGYNPGQGAESYGGANCVTANMSLDGLGAYYFQMSMLPQDILDEGITAGGGKTSRIALIR